ncbi:hypothetical protein JDM601_0669 [Mycolicibacter sinensis]|uniref:Uncharacterized protein n=1 Tax=Mycolicibacter sinensis (strain JDM601) TaxID=875328 RepID=F5Z3E3_MYCSD|nr:hypothetical protein JDM601_0669 [Mycolicibacter sinensis]
MGRCMAVRWPPPSWFVLVKGMGHDVPPRLWGPVSQALTEHFRR